MVGCDHGSVEEEIVFGLENLGLPRESISEMVSVLERFDVRDEWVQDVDRIEVTHP